MNLVRLGLAAVPLDLTTPPIWTRSNEPTSASRGGSAGAQPLEAGTARGELLAAPLPCTLAAGDRAAGSSQSRSPEVLKKERDEAQAEARQCQEDKARLLAERQEPGGLMGAAWLEQAGVVTFKDLGSRVRKQPGNALGTRGAKSYGYTRTGETGPVSVAVRLGLMNPGAEPWTLAGAALVDSMGEEVALAVWQEAPIPASGAGAVVVGIEGERAQLGCPCTLKLWEAQGPRTVTLGNVTFPASQKKEP
jgi:hypothetical protein